MKKIFLILIMLIIFINPLNIFANESVKLNCPIKNNSSEKLDKYFKNLRNILNNISNQAKKEKKIEKKYYSPIKLYNDAFNFNNLKNEINFFGFYVKFQEIPKEVERDYNKLLLEDNYIKELNNFLTKNWLENKIWKDICKWIENCSLSSNKLWEILWEIKKNHENIKVVFIKTTVWKSDFNKKNFILIEPNFFNDLRTNYWPEAISSCSEENWFLKEIWKKTTDIFNNENSAKEWVKKWKEAWSLVSWINTIEKEEYKRIERDLLKKELERQWIWWNAQEIILNNLEKYNIDWWFSKNNNFISNTFRQISDEFKNSFQELKDETISDFWNNYDEKNKNVINSLNAKDNSDLAKKIKSRIDKIYIENKNYTALYESNNSELRNRLINIHIELSNSINILNETCKMAVKICNQQDSWNWDCWNCNW